MGNPYCPNCGNIMQVRMRLTDAGTSDIGKQKYGMTKFWVCIKKGCEHIKFKCGAEVITKKSKPISEEELKRREKEIKGNLDADKTKSR